MDKNFEAAVLQTLSYFDLFNYPLTAEELFAYLWKFKIGYNDFLRDLENFSPNKIARKYGYYFLAGREETVENRRQRLLMSEMKLKIALKAARKIRSVPFLKAIFVCNSVAFGQANTGSDIDFFIVTAPRRTWIVRFFTNLILRFYGLRTYGNKIQDKICLSFFLDQNHLDLSSFKIGPDDIYLAYWLKNLVALYDADNTYKKLLAENIWAKNLLPNSESQGGYYFGLEDSVLGRKWKNIWEKMWQGAYGDLIEKQAELLQISKLKPSIKEAMNKESKNVILGDGVLKFHENDRRESFKQAWLEKIYVAK